MKNTFKIPSRRIPECWRPTKKNLRLPSGEWETRTILRLPLPTKKKTNETLANILKKNTKKKRILKFNLWNSIQVPSRNHRSIKRRNQNVSERFIKKMVKWTFEVYLRSSITTIQKPVDLQKKEIETLVNISINKKIY